MSASLSRYATRELVRFFEAIDAAVDHDDYLILIGGAAVALGYGGVSVTKDVDTLTSTDSLRRAIDNARRETGLEFRSTRLQLRTSRTSSRVGYAESSRACRASL